jgi:hypothetical protein
MVRPPAVAARSPCKVTPPFVPFLTGLYMIQWNVSSRIKLNKIVLTWNFTGNI